MAVDLDERGSLASEVRTAVAELLQRSTSRYPRRVLMST